MARQMLTRQFGEWGLGIGIQGQDDSLSFQHAGQDEGFEAYLVGFERVGDGAAVMTNGAGGDSLAKEIVGTIARAYDWPGSDYKPHERVPVSIAPERLRDYIGVYQFSDGTPARVEDRDGKLYISSPENGPAVLHPAGNDVFFTEEFTADFVFQRDDAGKVTVMVIRMGASDLATAKRVK
jgi:hypothetical protein